MVTYLGSREIRGLSGSFVLEALGLRSAAHCCPTATVGRSWGASPGSVNLHSVLTWNGLRATLLPEICLLCDLPAGPVPNLCSACVASLPSGPRASRERLVAFDYTAPVISLVHWMKFEANLAAALSLGVLLARGGRSLLPAGSGLGAARRHRAGATTPQPACAIPGIQPGPGNRPARGPAPATPPVNTGLHAPPRHGATIDTWIRPRIRRRNVAGCLQRAAAAGGVSLHCHRRRCAHYRRHRQGVGPHPARLQVVDRVVTWACAGRMGGASPS